jgi:hypothetical protein
MANILLTRKNIQFNHIKVKNKKRYLIVKMYLEASVRDIKDWLCNVFEFDSDFNVYKPRYCTKIMITHINWGGEPNPRAIKHQMLERFKYGNKLFGQVKSLDVLWTAKKHGQAEPDTVAFLTYEDRESHWYAIAFYNELFKINGIKCIFRPAAYSDNLNDEGVKVNCNLRSMFTNKSRNLYVECFGDYDFAWCNICCYYTLAENIKVHYEKEHYGERDISVFKGGKLVQERSTMDGYLALPERSTVNRRFTRSQSVNRAKQCSQSSPRTITTTANECRYPSWDMRYPRPTTDRENVASIDDKSQTTPTTKESKLMERVDLLEEQVKMLCEQEEAMYDVQRRGFVINGAGRSFRGKMPR